MRAILLAGGLALIFTLLGTRVAIRVLVAKGYGQLIRDDGPTTHHTKRGTPTMGGLVIIISVLLAYALAKLITQDLPSWSGILLLFLLVGLGTVGFVDDYIKVAKQRSLGLRSKAKMAGQTIVAVAFGWLALTRPDDRGNTPASTAISFTRDLEQWTLPAFLVIVLILVMIAGASNAVNLTDGLDGLAAGLATIAAGTFGIFAYLIGRVDTSTYLGLFYLPGCGELAIFCFALAGATLGFLWYNAHPADVFMGDTGSLALGGALGAVAILLKLEFQLVIIGGIFVLEALSVIGQVGWFKYTARRYGQGRRLLLMAPLHHHLEKAGWAESKIIVRFWIVGLFFSLIAFSTLKIR